MSLVEQWERIERGLPEGWSDARLALSVDDDAHRDRAAAVLAPLNAGRRGRQLRFFTARRGAGLGPEHMRRLLRRLDRDRVTGTLELLASGEPAIAPVTDRARAGLGAAWDALLATLPDDWSDLYCELELTSTDHLERGALMLAPVNPARHAGTPAFRFRVARDFGYGASPEMARRCFERLDEERIPGRIQVVRLLSDSRPVGTQGPVWRVGGRSV